MAYNGYSSITSDGLNLRNGLDLTIGTLGVVAGGIVLLSNPVGWIAVSCTIIGGVSAAYGTGTLIYDTYEEIVK